MAKPSLECIVGRKIRFALVGCGRINFLNFIDEIFLKFPFAADFKNVLRDDRSVDELLA